jgi:Helix-turn-helix domain
MTVTAQPTDKALDTGGYVYRVTREAVGLTRAELAELSGVSASTIGRIERGDVSGDADGVHCRFCGGVGRGQSADAQRLTDALVDYAHSRRTDSEAIS